MHEKKGIMSTKLHLDIPETPRPRSGTARSCDIDHFDHKKEVRETFTSHAPGVRVGACPCVRLPAYCMCAMV